jgi:hypothetical protein
MTAEEETMAEVRSREKNPVPGIDYSELFIPDEMNLGSGTFVTVLEPGAMSKINPIISSIVNEPAFLLMVSVNLAIESVTALIGAADKTPPRSRKVYKLPRELRTEDAHSFEVAFREWDIRGLTMDGKELELSEE